jgi:acyl-CoA synthetase (NDP forming)
LVNLVNVFPTVQVKRVQGLVEAVDRLRAALMQPPPKENQVVVTTQWETFDGGMGSLAVPPPSSASVNANWETFE